MSDPTYRIDVEHKPEDRKLPWRADVWQLSDETLVYVSAGSSADEVVSEAQAIVRELHTKKPGYSLFVDDDGRPVEGHSVKAS